MKKTVIKHKITDGYTACGRWVGLGYTTNLRGNKTWKGVTCQKCLGVKAKADRVKAAKKTGRVSTRKVATTT